MGEVIPILALLWGVVLGTLKHLKDRVHYRDKRALVNIDQLEQVAKSSYFDESLHRYAATLKLNNALGTNLTEDQLNYSFMHDFTDSDRKLMSNYKACIMVTSTGLAGVGLLHDGRMRHWVSILHGFFIWLGVLPSLFVFMLLDTGDFDLNEKIAMTAVILIGCWYAYLGANSLIEYQEVRKLIFKSKNKPHHSEERGDENGQAAI